MSGRSRARTARVFRGSTGPSRTCVGQSPIPGADDGHVGYFRLPAGQGAGSDHPGRPGSQWASEQPPSRGVLLGIGEPVNLGRYVSPYLQDSRAIRHEVAGMLSDEIHALINSITLATIRA